jgi:hypothetical protein
MRVDVERGRRDASIKRPVARRNGEDRRPGHDDLSIAKPIRPFYRRGVCLETALNQRVVLEREADGAPGVDQWLIDFRLGVIPFRLNGLRGASIVTFTARASLRLFSATRENWRKTGRKKGNVTRMVGRRCRNLLCPS